MYNYKTVFYTLGTLQMVLGVFMLVPVIIQLIYNELDSGFVSASIITIIFGILFFLSNLDHDKNIDLPQAFILTALSWLSIAIFGSLPFIFSELNLNFTEAAIKLFKTLLLSPIQHIFNFDMGFFLTSSTVKISESTWHG